MKTNLKNFIKTMKALSDPNRVKVLKMLEPGDLCACEIQTALGLAQPTVSRHLRLLEDAGFIRGRKQGQWVHYSLEGVAPFFPAALLPLLRDWLEDDPDIHETVTNLPSIRRRMCATSGVPDKPQPEQIPRMSMDKRRVLFICVHNSGRSQMAEAFLNRKAGDSFQGESAGLEPTSINPLVVEVMREKGIDLAGKGTSSVFQYYREGRLYDWVITVCRESLESKCPIFPGIAHRLQWDFDDPQSATGTHHERLDFVRRIRDEIEQRIDSWIAEQGKTPGGNREEMDLRATQKLRQERQ
jgi:arsenate reductase (thioredoxin)